MTDNEFLQAFESATIHPHDFPHKAHLRMAYLILTRDGWEDGLQHIREGIQRLAAAHGATRKYHETITVFWARMVWHAIHQGGPHQDFDALVERHPFLLNGRAVNQHYSDMLLYSDRARSAWVNPDVVPLPEDAAALA
jgi:hypothetical protein